MRRSTARKHNHRRSHFSEDTGILLKKTAGNLFCKFHLEKNIDVFDSDVV